MIVQSVKSVQGSFHFALSMPCMFLFVSLERDESSVFVIGLLFQYIHFAVVYLCRFSGACPTLPFLCRYAAHRSAHQASVTAASAGRHRVKGAMSSRGIPRVRGACL